MKFGSRTYLVEFSPNTEVGAVVTLDVLERGGLVIGENQGARGFVVAVGPELRDHRLLRFDNPFGPQLLGDVVGCHPQVVGVVVGTEVGTLSEDRAVLLKSLAWKSS